MQQLERSRLESNLLHKDVLKELKEPDKQLQNHVTDFNNEPLAMDAPPLGLSVPLHQSRVLPAIPPTQTLPSGPCPSPGREEDWVGYQGDTRVFDKDHRLCHKVGRGRQNEPQQHHVSLCPVCAASHHLSRCWKYKNKSFASWTLLPENAHPSLLAVYPVVARDIIQVAMMHLSMLASQPLYNSQSSQLRREHFRLCCHRCNPFCNH